MVKRESTYRGKISAELRTLGCVVIPIVGTAAGGSGWPDCYVCSRAISFFIEFKGVLTKHKDAQKSKMVSLKARGDIVYVLRDPGLLEDELGQFVAEVPSGFYLLKTIRELHPKSLKR